ncbi:MAG: transposase [Candidatus Nanoarchaeia archaeon]|nr:transposase [Candidatus Nanoarchaeia archaeon]
MVKLQKTLKIKLNPTKEQAERLKFLIEEYINVANKVVKKVNELQNQFSDSGQTNGKCSICGKEKGYHSKHLMKDTNNDLICLTCYKKTYSQYTLQKKNFQEKIGLRDDAKITKTFLTNAVRFVSNTIKGFDKIQDKKKSKLSYMEHKLTFWNGLLTEPSKRIEKKFKVIKYAPITDIRENPHFYSEAEIKSKLKRLEKKIKKFKMPNYPEFKNKTISLQKECYTWKKPEHLTLSFITKKGETIDYFGKTYLQSYMSLINIQNPIILLKQEGTEFYMCFPITKEVTIPKIDESFDPVGIDWGITRNIAVVTILNHKTKKPLFVKFYKAGLLLNKRIHYKNLRRKFGTKKRQDKINQLGSKEDKFIDRQIQDLSRIIITEITKHTKKPAIFMEKITDNREEASKFMRGKVLPLSVKERLQKYIAYKSYWEGIPIFLVPPEHTSQICSRCGNQDRNNRPKGSKLFKCTNTTCNYTANSDFNASVNIALKIYKGEYQPFDNSLFNEK